LLLVGLIVVGAIIYGGLSGSNKDLSALAPPGSEQPKIEYLPAGSAAPEFSHPATDGNTYSLSQFKGKVVVLQFMAPWCPHCQADAPMFNALHEKYKGKDVQFLDLSATDQNKDRNGPITMEDLTWFRDTYKVPFPMLLDKELKTANAYIIEYFPTVYIVDKNGNIIKGMNNDPNDPNGLENNIIAEVDKQLNQ
jgi:peroxiredoxin